MPIRGRRHTRHVRGAALLVIAVLLAIGVGVGVEAALGTSHSQQPLLQPSRVVLVSHRPQVESITLPTKWVFEEIIELDGHPTLLGARDFSTEGTPAHCIEAALDPRTLRFDTVQAYRCGTDPAARGAAVPVVSWPSGFQRAEVRIARTDPSTGRSAIGPVVMTFGQFSDTRLVSVSGYGSLWIYDVDTPQGAELLRISSASGKIENRIMLPKGTIRPTMVDDRAGLWIGISPGGASGASGSPIYFVRAGSNRARVVWRGGNSVWWALSDAGQVWFDVFDVWLSASHDQRLVRFDGAGPRPALDVAITGPAATWVTYESVIGTRSDGFWTLSWPSSSGEGLSCGSAAVLRIDPRTARASVTARLPAPTVDEYDGCNGLDTDEAVVSGGRLLVLAGQSSSLRANGYAQLDAVAAPRPSP